MDDGDHRAMLGAVQGLRGMVAISGYPSGLYNAALGGWRRVSRPALADGARARTECLWLNPTCVNALAAARVQGELLA